MIAALAKGGQVFDRPEYIRAARRAAELVLVSMTDSDGRLLHRYRDGQAVLSSNVDDYAFFIWGLLELYEATFDIRYLQSALNLNTQLIEHFWDPHAGGFYFTAKDSEELILRKKEIYDGATPSGNSVAALNLLRLARMTAHADFEHKAEQIGKTFSGNVRQLPSAFTMLLTAMELAAGPAYEVVVVGRSEAQDTTRMLAELRKTFAPNKVVIFRPTDREPEIAAIAPYTLVQKSIDGKATAYVCRNYHCEMPTTDPQEMLRRLDAR